jgi:hypothetical protein
MRSTGVDLFQILDLLLGAVAYDHKRAAGLLTGSSSNPKGNCSVTSNARRASCAYGCAYGLVSEHRILE